MQIQYKISILSKQGQTHQCDTHAYTNIRQELAVHLPMHFLNQSNF